MRLKKHGPLFESPLKRVARRPAASSLCNRCRRYASSQAYPEKVAILGGGISGLASAYFVSKEFPQSKITVHEANKDSGGWIQSRRVDVPGGHVLFEYGARTLRPGRDASITAQLVQDLQLFDQLLFTDKTSLAAKNRYIYYPDRPQLLPSSLDFARFLDLWRSGLLAGIPSVLLEPFRPGRPSTLHDESIGSFIERRFDKRLGMNLLSAVMHGIYAGDIWRLSARTLLAQAWQLEGMSGSIFKSYFQLQDQTKSPARQMLLHPYDLDLYKAMREETRLDLSFETRLDQSATFTFVNGMAELIATLRDHLENKSQVKFKFSTPVRDFKLAEGNPEQVEVTTGLQESLSTEKYDLVISSLRNPDLTPFVTVMTVNLYFPTPQLLRQRGFGYLIPQSVAFEHNPERALGVIFDSDAIQGQDTVDGTKLTVMLGGHYWDGWDHFPSEAEAYDLATSVVRRHLKIEEKPTHHHVNLSRDCIPQYTVGYEERLKAYACQVRDRFRGRVRVVGSQVGGVGVNDCIKGAWAMARGLRGVGWKGNGTGLERALNETAWVTTTPDEILEKRVK